MKITKIWAKTLASSVASTAAAVVLFSWITHAADAPFADRVRVDGGELKGAAQSGVLSFKGIPFAAPPVGDLRWRPPQRVANWTGVREATTYGHDCAQLPFPSDAAPLGPSRPRTAWC